MGIGRSPTLPGQVPETGHQGGDADHRHHPDIPDQPADRRQEGDTGAVGEVPVDVLGLRLDEVPEDRSVRVARVQDAAGGSRDGGEDVHPRRTPRPVRRGEAEQGEKGRADERAGPATGGRPGGGRRCGGEQEGERDLQLTVEGVVVGVEQVGQATDGGDHHPPTTPLLPAAPPEREERERRSGQHQQQGEVGELPEGPEHAEPHGRHGQPAEGEPPGGGPDADGGRIEAGGQIHGGILRSPSVGAARTQRDIDRRGALADRAAVVRSDTSPAPEAGSRRTAVVENRAAIVGG